jgi:crotonobetainyl-CoA:carnitine CoA-transferase CaiB-like acyl-CoA transferase
MPCKDDEYVFISCAAKGPIARILEFLGMSDDPIFPPGMQVCIRGDAAGEKLDAAIRQYCLNHNAAEVDKKMMEIGVPCSRIHNIETIQDDPHVQARELFMEWEDPRYGTLKGVNVVPKMKNRPGKIWKNAPDYGSDNEDILKELGYTQDQIDEFYTKKIITKTPENGGYQAKP